MKKRILSLLMVLCLAVGVFPVMAGAVTADSFTDVGKDSWYYDYVDYVAKKGYFVGTTATTFSPDRDMTRAMFVVVLARYDGMKLDNSKSAFSDVAPGAWCAGAVNWAAENNIVSGYSDGTFKPNDPITRAQMCAIMDRYVDYYTAKHKVSVAKNGTVTTMNDQSQIPSYALNAVKHCQKYGLIYGYTDGTFRPATNSTRAHVAAVIYRLTFLLDKAGSSSGGNGGSKTTKDTYLVKVHVGTPKSGYALDLTADYVVTTKSDKKTGDTKVDALAKELVTGENKTALTNAIEMALTDAKGKTSTATVDGQKVTVTVSDDGVISATTTLPASSILDSGAGKAAPRDAANVTNEDIEALMSKLEKGGNLSLNTTDVAALDKLLEKVEGLTTQEILDYVKEHGSDAMQQAIDGLTEEALEEARTTYTDQLKDIQAAVNAPDAVKDEAGNVVLEDVEPAMMTVAVNLQVYLDKADKKYTTEDRDKAIAKLADKLGVSDDRLEEPAVKDAVDAIYNVGVPSSYVEKSGNYDLKLKAKGDYYDMIVDYVDASCQLWSALGEDRDFYSAQLEKAENKDASYDFLSVEYTDVLAEILGTTEEITNTTVGETLNTTVTATEDTYPEMTKLLKSNLVDLGYSAIADRVPSKMPQRLKSFAGDYSLTISIEEQAE